MIRHIRYLYALMLRLLFSLIFAIIFLRAPLPLSHAYAAFRHYCFHYFSYAAADALLFSPPLLLISLRC